MKSCFFWNIVITPTAAILQLVLVKDKMLLIGRASFVLNFCFHHLNGVCWFYFQSGFQSLFLQTF